MVKCCYGKHCAKVGSVVLEEGERSVSAQSRKRGSSCEDGKVPETADELDRGRRLEIVAEKKCILSEFCFSFVKLAVRLRRRDGRQEAQKLMSVMFDVSFDSKELFRNMRRAQDWDCLTTERTQNALTKEGIRKKKLRREGERPNADAVLYKQNVLNISWKQVLATASGTLF